ncbi:hypothetical protein C8R43DRAFT_1238280 [Mycena crocata]|nr:hypothetical protein C8R43DRAFT_1238280 [Mycena crocata]
MSNQKTREWLKHVLWISRIKLIYARITLTRYTTLYFFLALLSCIALVAQQSVTYFSNTDGAAAVAGLVRQANVNTTTVGMPFLQNGDIILCHNIPGQNGSDCKTLVHRAHDHMHVRELSTLLFDERADAAPDLQQCAISLMWLGDVLSDARREDLVILVYQIWLFSLSMVTLLNESLPHLFAGLAARVLAMAWAGFRVQGNSNLLQTYYHVINTGKCDGFDPLGSWWNQSGSHEIASLVSNTLNLVLMAALSYKLFRVYSSQTFSRVGASTEINRIYKLVLLFSVSLQLAGFFTLAQTALWIGKISFGPIRQLADHFPIYLAALIVTAVFEMPWLVLGWISVRREGKALFLVFSFISLVLLFISTVVFTSPLYRFVMGQWSFYATMSVTAYILLVATSILAVICRLQFGKGLAHFLRVTDALEAGDFTPVYFSKGSEDHSGHIHDDVKAKFDQFDNDPDMPVLAYSYSKDEKEIHRPQPSHRRKLSSMSVLLSDTQASGDTIKLSSTPALFRSATEAKRISPIMVQQPVIHTRSPSSASPSRERGKRPPNIHVGVGPTSPEDSYPRPAISVSPVSSKHARSETVDERASRQRSTEPAKPPQAAVRSRSVPRRVAPGGAGLPRRPSDGKGSRAPPAGYF